MDKLYYPLFFIIAESFRDIDPVSRQDAILKIKLWYIAYLKAEVNFLFLLRGFLTV